MSLLSKIIKWALFFNLPEGSFRVSERLKTSRTAGILKVFYLLGMVFLLIWLWAKLTGKV